MTGECVGFAFDALRYEEGDNTVSVGKTVCGFSFC